MINFDFRPRPLNGPLTKTISLALILLGLVVVLVVPVNASRRVFPTYNIVDLGVLPGRNYSVAYGVNNVGQVVGESGLRAFLYTYDPGGKGAMTDLGTLPKYVTSYAYGINNAGQVTGYCQNEFGTSHAFLYDGTMKDLGALPSVMDASSGHAINNLGQVVGWSPVGTGPAHAFLYDGTMKDLGTVSTPGFTQSQAYALNDNGWVVGKAAPGGGVGHAFIYANGVMTDIGVAWEAAGYYSAANGVNNAGQVLVTAHPTHGGGSSYAAVYKDGKATLLGSGIAEGINSAGQVVGSLGTGRPFLYVPQNGMVDLNLLIVGTNPFIQLQAATAISDNGYIAGSGQLPDGSVHAFLAVPGPGNKIFGGYVPYLLLLD